MQIQPILVALKKHRLATMLIALEIALACAVLCNAVFIIANRLSAMHIVTGVDEASLGEIVVTGFDPKQAGDLNARMIAGLAAIPGIESVHAVSSVPFGPQAVASRDSAFGVAGALSAGGDCAAAEPAVSMATDASIIQIGRMTSSCAGGQRSSGRACSRRQSASGGARLGGI